MKSDVGGEYRFHVTADGGSRVALSVSGRELFNDLLAPTAQSSSTPTTTGSAEEDVPGEGDSVDSHALPGETPSMSATDGGGAVSEGRASSAVLPAGELVPLQLRYAVRERKGVGLHRLMEPLVEKVQ